MDAARIIDALGLPDDARVDKKVPKKLLLEQGAPTAADKRLIQEGIEALHWIAALKPGNVAVPVFRDEVRAYTELAVAHAVLRPKARTARLLELIHRAIPYPLALLVTGDEGVLFSLAHKRFSQGEAGRVVLDGVVAVERLGDGDGVEAAFLEALALSRQNATDLYALYQGWMGRMIALTAARLTGIYGVSASVEGDQDRREVLREHEELIKKLAGLSAQAAKEKQLNRRVELNVEIQGIQKALDALVVRLKG
ncbi:conserved hypothetical protein [Magnetococcus marinus MC-1]|uniref:DUF4391 domain-containing protein n=2 Tax=Magnetococcus TaxID=162171 RepID=A0L5R2_MAGMM|nr:conserved hypothetical protein [Magnetococcus marinus MC-1]